MSTNEHHCFSKQKLPLAIALAAGVMGTPALAFNIDTGNRDLSVRLDTTAKYSLGVRVEDREDKIANNRNFDETEYKFDQGDVIMNRIDLLTELDVVYKRQYGFRVSAAGWYDHAYNDQDVGQNPALAAQGWQSSYDGDRYSNTTKRFAHGPSGEILDAFVFANLTFGNTPLFVKAGAHTVYWGAATFDFFGQGINYGQAPLDARKSASSPGTTAKESFLPVPQISLVSQVAPTVSVAGQYFLDWEPTRFPEGGTYFAGSDILFSGPDRLPIDPGFSVPRLGDIEPDDKHGSFGLMASWTPDFLRGGSLSTYYRRFDDPTPWLVPQVVMSGNTAVGYRLVYPEDIKLYGIGLNMNVLGASVGFDVSYRKDAPLIATGISPIDNEGPRGDTIHVIFNFVKGLTQTPLWDTGTFIAELSYSHLREVTKHKELFKGGSGCAGGVDRGCATQNFWGIGFQFNPQWPQVFPGIDLSLPITARYGLSGNGATSMSGNEGAYSYSIGLAADVYQKYKVQLTYSDSHADIDEVEDVPGVGRSAVSGNGSFASRDRGWVSLTIQTTF